MCKLSGISYHFLFEVTDQMGVAMFIPILGGGFKYLLFLPLLREIRSNLTTAHIFGKLGW